MDKNWHGLLIVAALAIFSCEDSHDIGLGLDPDGIRVNVLYTELPIEVTNVRIDSIRTNGASNMLIGKHSDDIFGSTSATLFAQLNLSNNLEATTDNTDTIQLEDEFDIETDSIIITTYEYVHDTTFLELDIDFVHTENVSSPHSYNIHQLIDTIYSEAYYLANFNTPYFTDSIEAELNFTLDKDLVELLEKDSTYLLRFELNENWGNDFIEIGKSTSPSGNIRFNYKGIAIVGDENNKALIGLKPATTNLSVDYHIIENVETLLNRIQISNETRIYKDSLELNIAFNFNNAYYSSISVDRSGSLMSNEAGDYNSFTVGDGNIYLQPATGIFPKLNLDTLNKFFAAHPNIQINRMEFSIETKENSEYISNVDNLRFMYVNGSDGSKINNDGILTNILSETAILTDAGYLSGTSTPLISELDETSLIYGGVPTFFAQLVEIGTIEVDHLILFPQDVTTPDYSVFDEENGFRVKLYYTLPE
ncbi:MAG: DUF4270 family protein [Reichenbachiella sp.]|uniref:DUF4270 family protein n=1 Tax=Reichenbachiella sp. TaxID=2184521 RepID=UPI00329A6BC3